MPAPGGAQARRRSQEPQATAEGSSASTIPIFGADGGKELSRGAGAPQFSEASVGSFTGTISMWGADGAEHLTEGELFSSYGFHHVRGVEFDDVEVLRNSWRQ